MQDDVRAALQYVPLFRGKLFFVLIEAGKLPDAAIAECLLDLVALEDIGVKLVIGVLNGDLKDFYDWCLECEMKAALVTEALSSGNVITQINQVLSRGQVPVINASGVSLLDEKIINLTLELKAAKLIVLSEDEILIQGKPIHAMRASDALICAEKNEVTHAALLHAAAVACTRGVPRVHVLSGKRQGVLVDELFSNEGVGTMVHGDDYRRIRPLTLEDIPELLGMIGRSVRRSFLVPRDYEEISEKIANYYVMDIDSNVVGCVALHPYPSHDCAEVACLYVKQSHEGRGYGAELVSHAENVAKIKAIPRVFALTNRAAEFFAERMHYHEIQPQQIPPARAEMLAASGRNSRIFEKLL